MGWYAGKGGPRRGPFYSGFSFKTGPYIGYRGPKVGGAYTGYIWSAQGQRRQSSTPTSSAPLGRVGRAFVVVCFTPFLWLFVWFLASIATTNTDGANPTTNGGLAFAVASAVATLFLLIGLVLAIRG